MANRKVIYDVSNRATVGLVDGLFSKARAERAVAHRLCLTNSEGNSLPRPTSNHITISAFRQAHLHASVNETSCFGQWSLRRAVLGEPPTYSTNQHDQLLWGKALANAASRSGWLLGHVDRTNSLRTFCSPVKDISCFEQFPSFDRPEQVL